MDHPLRGPQAHCHDVGQRGEFFILKRRCGKTIGNKRGGVLVVSQFAQAILIRRATIVALSIVPLSLPVMSVAHAAAKDCETSLLAPQAYLFERVSVQSWGVVTRSAVMPLGAGIAGYTGTNGG